MFEAKRRLPIRASRGDGLATLAADRSSQRGYTLIEVLVAFAVLAGALTLLLAILTGASRQVRWAAEAGRAALHAQSLLDQAGIGEPLQPGQSDGGFEDGRYQWTLVVEPWRDPSVRDVQPMETGGPQMMQLDLLVRWGEGGPREHLQLRSLRLVTPDPLQGGGVAP